MTRARIAHILPLVPVRHDRGTIAKVETTPQGGLRVDAYLTRTGVFDYYGTDGKLVREYRSAEQVFAPASIATLDAAPVTRRHPPRLVDRKNFREYSRGHVIDGASKPEGNKIASRLVIQADDLVNDVEQKLLREVSCGYHCDLLDTPGTSPEGERYDRVQMNIRYNHVAIVEHGRAGKEVALRLDASGDQIDQDRADERTEQEPMKSIRIDGHDWPLGTPAEVDAAIRAQVAFTARTDSAAGAAVAEKAKLDAALVELAAAKAALVEANDPKRLDERVNARADLVKAAGALLGADFKADGKTDREIKIAAITKAGIKLDEKASDDFLAGVFSGLAVSAPAPTTAPKSDNADVRRALRGDATKTDGVPTDPVERMKYDAANAWKQPLAAHKGS